MGNLIATLDEAISEMRVGSSCTLYWSVYVYYVIVPLHLMYFAVYIGTCTLSCGICV